jgi:hypothetical protein
MIDQAAVHGQRDLPGPGLDQHRLAVFDAGGTVRSKPDMADRGMSM